LGLTLLPHIIPILFPKFTIAIEAIQIMSLAIIPTTVDMIYVSKFLALENNRVLLIASIITLAITIIGTIVLGPMFSTRGVATAFVLSTTGEAVFLVLASRRQKNTQRQNSG
jgi:O-antigen/teichoic acid export membrane protein